MIIFLDEAYERWQREGRLRSKADLHEAIIEGAVQRVRPKMMTASAIFIGLLPIMWSQGTGADVMKRIAAPMIGGMVSSTLLTLLVIPAIYALVITSYSIHYTKLYEKPWLRIPRSWLPGSNGRRLRNGSRKRAH